MSLNLFDFAIISTAPVFTYSLRPGKLSNFSGPALMGISSVNQASKW